MYGVFGFYGLISRSNERKFALKIRSGNGELRLAVELKRIAIFYLTLMCNVVCRMGFALVGVSDLHTIEGGWMRLRPYEILRMSIILPSPRRAACVTKLGGAGGGFGGRLISMTNSFI